MILGLVSRPGTYTSSHSDKNWTALSLLPTIRIHMHISWFSSLPVASGKEKRKKRERHVRGESRNKTLSCHWPWGIRMDLPPQIWVPPQETPSREWHTWGFMLGFGWNNTKKGYFSTLFNRWAWKRWGFPLRADRRGQNIELQASSLPFRG